MKIPKDTSKLKKHLALMCDRLNKGGKLDLSSQTGEPLVQQQLQKAVAPLEPLSEMQEEEDETGQLRRVQGFFFPYCKRMKGPFELCHSSALFTQFNTARCKSASNQG